MFPCDNIRETFTVMHYPVFEHLDTLSIAFFVSMILYIDGKQFRCSVFTFVQYIIWREFFPILYNSEGPVMFPKWGEKNLHWYLEPAAFLNGLSIQLGDLHGPAVNQHREHVNSTPKFFYLYMSYIVILHYTENCCFQKTYIYTMTSQYD